MKTIGLIGGMSWESTVPYYQVINRTVAKTLGGLHSAKVLLYSVDFDEIEVLQREDRWIEAGDVLGEVAETLEAAGADLLAVATNTMHRVAPAIEARIEIPLLHIADATADAIKSAGLAKVGLLGTAFTMEQDFYRGRLVDRHDLEVCVPNAADRGIVHATIYDELCKGDVRDASRVEFQRIIAGLAEQGAGGVILGCTEIPMLVGPGDVNVPVFDTGTIHATAIAEAAMA